MPVATAARMLYTLCLPSRGVMICSLPKGVRMMTWTHAWQQQPHSHR